MSALPGKEMKDVFIWNGATDTVRLCYGQQVTIMSASYGLGGLWVGVWKGGVILDKHAHFILHARFEILLAVLANQVF